MLRHRFVNSLFIIEMLERLNKIWRMQEAYTDYPKAASENAKTALRWAERNGWGGTEGVEWARRKIEQLKNED